MYNSLCRQQQEINQALSHYVFRPTLIYTMITDTRSQGFTPDQRGFRMQVGEWTLSETDVAMSLVRLYNADELSRVRRCAMCDERWLVAAKRHYQFCSGRCREAFYAKSPGYSKRRAEIQRKYRANLKYKHAKEDEMRRLISREGVRHAKS